MTTGITCQRYCTFLRWDQGASSSLCLTWQRKSSPWCSLPSSKWASGCGSDCWERISRLFHDNSNATIEMSPAHYSWHFCSVWALRGNLKEECHFIEFCLGNTSLVVQFCSKNLQYMWTQESHKSWVPKAKSKTRVGVALAVHLIGSLPAKTSWE